MQAVVVVFRFPPYLSMNAIIILPPSSSKVRLQELNYFTTKQCSVQCKGVQLLLLLLLFQNNVCLVVLVGRE
jgi:hypothetical protein